MSASYDWVVLALPVQEMSTTYNDVSALVQDIQDSLVTIDATSQNLALDWTGGAAGLADEFSQRWVSAAQSMFGSDDDPMQGAYNQLLAGIHAAVYNYEGADFEIMNAFGQIAESIVSSAGSQSGSGSGTPQSVTNTGSADDPSTFITETF